MNVSIFSIFFLTFLFICPSNTDDPSPGKYFFYQISVQMSIEIDFDKVNGTLTVFAKDANDVFKFDTE